MIRIIIKLLNNSGIDVLYHTGNGDYMLLKQNESVSVICTDRGVLNLYIKHTYGSYACEPDLKKWYEWLGYYLLFKQQRDYHAAVTSVFTFSGLQEDSEVVINHRKLECDENVYLHCYLVNSTGLFENMHHVVEDYKDLTWIFKKKFKKITAWWLSVYILLDGGLWLFVLFLIATLTTLITRDLDYFLGIGFISIFALLTLLPEIVGAVKAYRRSVLSSPMTSQYICDIIIGEENNLPVKK